MTNTILIILGAGTLIVATLAFLATITDWFKKRIPIDHGFLLNGEIVNKLSLSTGDEAKPISLRFHNRGDTTLTGVILDIRFLKPLALSGTQAALTFIPGKTIHGRTEDKSYYLIRYSEIEMVGKDNIDFRVELNTKGKSPGMYKVLVTIYSTQQDYKYKKSELMINMN
jgi:hypothetical protein